MIRALIFDIGGVLIRTEDRSQRAALEKRLGLEPGAADTLVFNSEMGQKAQQGAITTAELWAWVQNHLQLDAAGLQQFQREFWGGDRTDVTLLHLIRRLHTRYQTAIISNATDNLHETVAQLDPTGDLFDLVVGSAYEKVMKPDPLIFERTLTRLGRAPAEAVFIDDFIHNVRGAQAVGLHAIHFTPGIELASELARLGVTSA